MRLITLPNGQQVRGGKNYVCTPKPGLYINQHIEIPIPLDAAANTVGAKLSLYLRGETQNTQTPLKVYMFPSGMVHTTVTPDEFKTGKRIDMTKPDGPCSIVFNLDAGEFKLWHFAVMLSDEMDDLHVIDKFNQYYPRV